VGISPVAAEFLALSRKDGTRFDKTLTLGRQDLVAGYPVLESILKQFDCWPSDLSSESFRDSFGPDARFGDALFKYIGAQQVSFLDASDFEGADVIHDLNLPVPEHMKQTYDAIYDGGLLEHVFNAPAAFKSCMEILKVDGRLLLVTPANNLFGHGFYQFSPELFFRLFSEANGFEVERMIAVERDYRSTSSRWFEVHDPAKVGQRVILENRSPVTLLVRARKVRVTDIRFENVQQSDYAAAWESFADGDDSPHHTSGANNGQGGKMSIKDALRPVAHRIARILPSVNPVSRSVFGGYYKYRSFSNRKFFTPIIRRTTW